MLALSGLPTLRLLVLSGLLALRLLTLRLLALRRLAADSLPRDVAPLVSRLAPVAEAGLSELLGRSAAPGLATDRFDGLLAPHALFHVALDLLGTPPVGRRSLLGGSILPASLVSASLSVSVVHRKSPRRNHGPRASYPCWLDGFGFGN